VKQLTLHSAKSTKQIQTHRVWQKSNYPNKRQAGFSLIEVMVAAFVLGIGILGIVGLQALSLKGTQQSSMRHNATALVYSLVEKMRANVEGTQDGDYDLTKTEYDAYNCATAITSCTSSSAICNPKQLADYDMHRFICGYGSAGQRARGIKATAAGDQSILTEGLLETTSTFNTVSNVTSVGIKISWTERELDKNETLDTDAVTGRTDFIELNTRVGQ